VLAGVVVAPLVFRLAFSFSTIREIAFDNVVEYSGGIPFPTVVLAMLRICASRSRGMTTTHGAVSRAIVRFNQIVD